MNKLKEIFFPKILQPKSTNFVVPSHLDSIPDKKDSDNYLYVPDKILKEIFQKLIDSERDRIQNKVDPNLATQINHEGCCLLFSRTGKNPFEIQEPQAIAQAQPKEYQNLYSMPIDENLTSETPNSFTQQANKAILPLLDNQTSTRILSAATETSNHLIYVTETPNSFIQQNNKDIMPILDSQASTRILSAATETSNHLIYVSERPIIEPISSPVLTDDIPVEVNKAIEKDLIKNPLKKPKRRYRIVLYKNNTGKESKVINLVVKSPNKSSILPPIENSNKSGYYYDHNHGYLQLVKSEKSFTVNESVITVSRNDSRFR